MCHCHCYIRPSVDDAPFQRGGGEVMTVVRVCFGNVCGCPHGMYLVLYAASLLSGTGANFFVRQVC